MIVASHHTDWASMLNSWDRQQSGYLRERERRFTVVMDALSDLDGLPLRVLDLGCGPGSFAARLLNRFPMAEVVALDMDPVLLAVGAGALGTANGRLSWVDADLRVPGWDADLADRPFDAIVSSTALHWLGPAQLVAVFTRLARLVDRGGRFFNADHMAYDREQPALAALAERISRARQASAFELEGIPDWDAWWGAAADVPELSEARAERQRRQSQRMPDEQDHIPLTRLASLSLHVTALHEAGFSEVGTIWQDYDDRILLAIR